MLVWVALTFITTIAVIIVINSVLALSADRRRLEQLTAENSAPAEYPTVGQSIKTDAMPTIAGFIRGRRFTESLYRQLVSAGLPIRPSEFVGIVAGSVLVFTAIGILFHAMLALTILLVVGALLPITYLHFKIKARRAAFSAQIVDALMMISSSLRSGFSLLRAMQIVAQEMPSPISEEFQRAISEVSIGRPLEDALRSVVDRVDSYDFDLAVTAMMIQMQVGGNLADIMDTIAGTIRERIRILNEMKALTAEGRFSGALLFILPLFLGFALTYLNPSYMSVLLDEPLGHLLIGMAIVLQIMGGWMISRMLRLDI